MGIKDDFYYYDMPYLEKADNLYEALKNGISTSLLAEKVFDLLSLMTKQNIIQFLAPSLFTSRKK